MQSLIPLDDLLTSLEQNFDVTFLYKNEIVPNKYVESDKVQIGEETGQELSEVLHNLNLEFERMDEQTYVLLRKKVQKEQAVLQTTVTGIVTDANTGESLPGVNVVVKGTTTGTSTNTAW
ncbi:MAG: hypothetical protein U5K69_10000 [Balneolaceae bacterium]|nr:hypothetical protein [Balneolaceae bacterium]